MYWLHNVQRYAGYNAVSAGRRIDWAHIMDIIQLTTETAKLSLKLNLLLLVLNLL